MSEIHMKTKENKDALNSLDNNLNNVNIEIKGESITVALIKKEIKNTKGETKTIVTVDHEEFPEEYNVIRLYLPIMGATGYVPTVDEIVELFKGNEIKPPSNAFMAKSGKTYSVESVIFRPLAENVYKGKVQYYGETIVNFPEK
ncbi:hypothetical protein [Staphylococcus hyicus]|uniref:hypothetical protein n=1 Tax=Staphylococcus hyicus TaxID=1284 RepID=UPI00313308FB